MIRVAVIVERVEQNLEVIVAGERVVAAQLPRDDAARIRIATHDPEIDGLAIDQHAHFGVLRHRFANARVLLHEIRCRLGPLPGHLVEHAVDLDRGRDPSSSQCLRRHRRLRAGDRSGRQNGERDRREPRETFG